ncbi:helix-turn-helix domain-containing protein [uncultured Oscillibacter sp.]|uniref:helix-turn-helix domain-containing protein n=1 Tax=uncultured Oscillibacter sp. TaxID=876091 RepID=UPI00260655D5|nr:helix-turn-helix transcriptional regulator [uncultured Oscillibacter sp.]
MIIELGDRLRKLRMENHLRQDQVARLVGVERSSVSLWEGNLRQPSYTTLVRLANLYGVTTDYLLGRVDDRLLDLSGLTSIEVALVAQLVAEMTAKNKKLEELRS